MKVKYCSSQIQVLFDGSTEGYMGVVRRPGFYKQRDSRFCTPLPLPPSPPLPDSGTNCVTFHMNTPVLKCALRRWDKGKPVGGRGGGGYDAGENDSLTRSPVLYRIALYCASSSYDENCISACCVLEERAGKVGGGGKGFLPSEAGFTISPT